MYGICFAWNSTKNMPNFKTYFLKYSENPMHNNKICKITDLHNNLMLNLKKKKYMFFIEIQF